MNIRYDFSKTTGNSVADIREEKITCPRCKGDGEIDNPDTDTTQDKIDCPDCPWSQGYFIRKY